MLTTINCSQFKQSAAYGVADIVTARLIESEIIIIIIIMTRRKAGVIDYGKQ